MGFIHKKLRSIDLEFYKVVYGGEFLKYLIDTEKMILVEDMLNEEGGYEKYVFIKQDK